MWKIILYVDKLFVYICQWTPDERAVSAQRQSGEESRGSAITAKEIGTFYLYIFSSKIPNCHLLHLRSVYFPIKDT